MNEMRNDEAKKVSKHQFDQVKEGQGAKRPFVKPELIRHERLHQVARFGQAASLAGLQTVGVAS